MIDRLLEIRGQLKDRKPDFIRQDNPKRMKLNDKWRKPKGIHSKIRHKFKGRRKMPSPGYKSPRKVKGLHSSGLKPVIIFSVSDIEKIRKESEGAIISKKVGIKARLEILRKANEINIQVLNLNVHEQIKKIEDWFKSKNQKDVKESKKEESNASERRDNTKLTEKKKDAKKEPEKLADIMSDEEKKEFDKKEKDKVLTKKV